MTEFSPILNQNDQLFEFGSMSGELNISPDELAMRNLGGVALRETGEGAGVVSGEFTIAEMNAFATSTLNQHYYDVMAHLDALNKQEFDDDNDDEESDRDY